MVNFIVLPIKNQKSTSFVKEYKGMRVVPESGITLYSLIKAIKYEKVQKDDFILLNINGGGRQEIKKERYSFTPSTC